MNMSMSVLHGFAVTVLLLAQAAPGRHWVVRKDGSAVELRAAPGRRGNAWVGVLVDGQLVAIPAAEVDEGRTVEANRTGAGIVPTPAPTFTPTIRVPGSTVPLGDRVKLSASPEDVQKKLESARVVPTLKPGEVESPVEEPPTQYEEKARVTRETVKQLEAKAAGKAGASGEHKDFSGRGESYWKGRAGKVKGELERARNDASRAGEALAAHERTVPPGRTQASQGSWAGTLQKLRNDVSAAQRREARAQEAMDALREEARKADAYPGWVR